MWWRYVVIKSPVFVVGDDEHTVFPVGRVTNRLVNLLYQHLTACNIILWMLRIAANKIRQDVIVRLDKGIGRRIVWIIHITAEVLKVFETSLDSMNGHAADSQRLGEGIAAIDGPTYPLIVKTVIDAAIVKFIAVDEERSGDIGSCWTVIQAPRRCCMDKEAVGPCRTRHGGKPVIAYGKLPREGCDHRNLIRGITFHDLAGIGLIDTGIIGDEATIVDLWIIALDSAELNLNVIKLMTWIVRHHPIGRRGNKYFISIQVQIEIVSRVQSLDGCWLHSDSVDALYIGKPQQVVKGPVFHHEHKNVFDAIWFRLLARKESTGCPHQLYPKLPENVDQVD